MGVELSNTEFKKTQLEQSASLLSKIQVAPAGHCTLPLNKKSILDLQTVE